MINSHAEARPLLDDLSLNLRATAPDDLPALGEALQKLERLTECYSSPESGEEAFILTGIQKTLEAVILEQAPDKDQAMNLAGRGVSLLQEFDRNLDDGPRLTGGFSEYVKVLKFKAGIELGQFPPPTGGLDSPEKKPRPGAGAGGSAAPAAPSEKTDNAPIDQDQELFFSFLTEAMEHIETIEVNVINLETEPDNQETINAVFRPFHTIKGVSGFLNLPRIHGLTHEVENILDDARALRLPVTPPLIDLVLDAVDLLKRMINDLKEAEDGAETSRTDEEAAAIKERINAIRNGEPLPSGEAPATTYGGWKLGEILADQGLLTLEELDDILTAKEEDQLRPLGERLVAQGIIDQRTLEKSLARQLEAGGKKLGEILVESTGVDPRDVSRAIVEQAVAREQKLGEFLVKEKKAEARDVAQALRMQKNAVESSSPAAMVRTVKVDTTKLDSLVDLIGELVIAQTMVNSNGRVAHSKDQKLERDLAQVNRITSELQKTAMSMRMVPIRQTFQKMIRLVRDLSRKSGKRAELHMSGEETEIDRNMVEAIYDPLVHMIRNSVDHGLETPEDRVRAGKPDQGAIHLRAFHQGGNIVIEIQDDGLGLNRDKILAKARERGLVEPGASLSDADVYGLIFHPGFSTAEKITDVSGRGVGMDVVKKAIEKQRGKVEVRSTPGRGTTIAIRLPLTLAIIDGMIVRVGVDRYIIPTTAIKEAFQVAARDYHTVADRGEVIQVRGDLLPLIRLYQVFEIEPSRTEVPDSLIVVLENNGTQKCVMIDEVLGKQEVVIKSLGEGIRKPKAVSGGTILGDGRVGLILDVAGVFEATNQAAPLEQ